jgi:FdhE protein
MMAGMSSAVEPVRHKTDWDKRLRRADELRQREPAPSEVLEFYRRILAVQQRIHDSASELAGEGPRSGGSLRQQLDLAFAVQWLPAVLDVVAKHGPAKLAAQAERLNSTGAEPQRILVEFLREDQAGLSEAESFLARAVLQPCAEVLARQWPRPLGFAGSTCPTCGGKPQFAVLRPEGDGGKRHLACSFCLTEWEFRRVLCPACEEVDYTKLPRYSPDDPIAVRVEACDTCKYYLKSFDMTVDGLIVPEVDEIATVALDLWAAQQGYYKIQPNLLGF